MRRTLLSRLAVLLTACLLVLSLTACATTLSGTYTARDSLLNQSFTFLKENRVKMSAFNLSIEGEYHIEDDTITITYTVLGLSYDWTNSFRKDGPSIYIGDTEFVRSK